MTTSTLARSTAADSLGAFLRDRRARLRPEPGAAGRRRTPGLRREEVAARAGVSVTWYTWLEQGRGGPPSDEVLERLSSALELDADGREMLFLIAQQRPPPLVPTPPPVVEPPLQRVLDAMPTSPALVITPAWQVIGWNAAAAAVLTDYAALPHEQRNLLRRLFGGDPAMRASLPNFEANARFVLAVFRIGLARAGHCPEAEAILDELLATSEDFRRLWAENDARSYGAGHKHIQNPIVGPIELYFSAFSVDGAPGLTMVVFTPASPEAERAVATLMARGGA